MTRPWTLLASAPTPEGLLELKQRGDSDYLILVGGRVLMNSFARSSEEQLARLSVSATTSRVLIGGLGMGFTLRAALDALSPSARVLVAELNPVIVEWCRGPLARATRSAVDDPRVEVRVADVAHVLQNAKARSFDAILLDLYEGPTASRFWQKVLGAVHATLAPDGVLAIWGEDRDAKFVELFRRHRFEVDVRSLTAGGSGGRKHVVYLGTAR